jgi:hypothetical protein
MKVALVVLFLCGCASPGMQDLSFDQKMQVYDRMKINPPQIPFYPMQVYQQPTVTCQRVGNLIQCY